MCDATKETKQKSKIRQKKKKKTLSRWRRRTERARARTREGTRKGTRKRALFFLGRRAGVFAVTRAKGKREREREKKKLGKFEKRKAMPEKKTRVQKKKREVVENIYEDCPNGCRGKEEGDEEERASDGDEMDANVVERLFRACERVCSDSSVGTPATAPLTTSSSSSSFATRRREQRERTREIYERLKPHLERVTARDVGLVWKREHYEDEDTSGDDTDEDEEEEKEEEEEFTRDPLKSLFANMFKRTKKKRDSKRSSPFSALTNAFQAGRKKSPAVHSQRIYACEDFQICTFIIPEGMEIPLHNHPEMTVLSKCLYGAARVQTYKWTDGMYENASARKPRACDLVSDVVIDASNGGIQVCSPEENIHRIVAITDVAILDVFVPPYDVDGERDCTYYELKREKSKEDIEIEPEQRVPALVEIEDSAFECFAVEYRGLKISGNR